MRNKAHEQLPEDFLNSLSQYLETDRENRPIALEGMRQQFPSKSNCLDLFVSTDELLNNVMRPLQDSQSTLATDGNVDARSTELPAIDGYSILEMIAEGGMGVVYRAIDNKLGRTVAIKLSKPSIEFDIERFAPLWTEASRISRLNHPNIVPLFGYGSCDGRQYFTMLFMSGGTLARKIAQRELTSQMAVAMMATVARAVQFAHHHGVIHRDIKPSNIMFDEHGVPRIGDFGLAMQSEDCEDSKRAIVGTLVYMAPEQMRGGELPTSAVDIFGLGVVLFEAISGQPPFGDTPIWKRMLDPGRERVESLPSLPAHVDAELKAICEKCLHVAPERRYKSADMLATDLENWLRHEPVSALPPTPFRRLRKWVRRSPVLATLTLIALVSSFVAITSLVFGIVAIRNEQVLTSVALIDKTNALAEKSAAVDELLRLRERDQGALTIQSIALADRELAAGRADPALKLLDSGQSSQRGWEWLYLHNKASRKAPLDTIPFVVYDAAFQPGFQILYIVGGLAGVKSDAQIVDLSRHGKARPDFTDWSLSAVHSDAVSVVAFDLSHERVLLGDLSGTLSLWQCRNSDSVPSLIACVKISDQAIRAACALETCGRFAIGLADGTVLIRNAVDLSPVSTIASTQSGCWALRYCCTNDTIAICRSNDAVEVYAASDGKRICETGQHEARISGIEFVGQGSQLLTTSHDSTIRLWNASTGREEFRSDRQAAPILHARHAEGNLSLFTGGPHGQIRLWDIPSRQFVDQSFCVDANVSKIAADSTGTCIVAFSDDGRLTSWKNRPIRLSVNLPNSDANNIASIQSATKFDYLPGRVQACMLPSDQLHVTRLRESPTRTTVLAMDSDSPWEISSCGARILSIEDRSLNIWDIASSSRIARLPQRKGTTSLNLVDCAGDYVVAAEAANVISVWKHAEAPNQLFTRTVPGAVLQCEFQVGSRYVIAALESTSGSSSKHNKSYLLQRYSLDGALTEQAEVAGERFCQIDGGKMIACYGDQPRITLVDSDSFRPIGDLHIDISPVKSVADDSGCDRLFLLTSQGDVHVWDWRAQRRMLVIPSSGERIEYLKSYDGTLFGFNENGFLPSWSTNSQLELGLLP